MKALVIDGYNVIHKIPHLEQLMHRSLRQARDGVTKLAKEYQRKTGGVDTVCVVFDGRDDYRGSFSQEPAHHVFSGTGKGDDEVIRAVKRLSAEYNVIVVTDDNYVRNNARAHKAHVITVERFKESVRKKKKSAPGMARERLDESVRSRINNELRKHWNICVLFALVAAAGVTAPAARADDVDFCVYHFKENISVIIYGFNNVEEERYRFVISAHRDEETGYPLFVTFQVYRDETEPVLTRHVITFVPIDTGEFLQRIAKDKTLVTFEFLKIPVSEEEQEKHLKAIHEFTYTVPFEEYTAYLVPEVLKKDENGEPVFELKPTQTLKDVPKRLVPKPSPEG
jgi:predicted RNA-binding protein with PIN domain